MLLSPEHRSLPPGSVVTFTNKAANEMKIRLCKMIGAETVDKLVMGTFHSCVNQAIELYLVRV